ncbi:MAG: hypothetical protein JSV92_02225 [archaeon]|nr:MAG: hypothetical protein JSV92_02225 [archaeon]
MAVFTKNLSPEKRNELINYARCKWEFSGEYSDPEKIIEDAGQRVVERHGNAFHVLKEGKFSHILVYDFNSLSRQVIETLYNVFGIKVLSFKEQTEKEEELKKEEIEEIPVSVENEGKYKRIEPL